MVPPSTPLERYYLEQSSPLQMAASVIVCLNENRPAPPILLSEGIRRTASNYYQRYVASKATLSCKSRRKKETAKQGNRPTTYGSGNFICSFVCLANHSHADKNASRRKKNATSIYSARETTLNPIRSTLYIRYDVLHYM